VRALVDVPESDVGANSAVPRAGRGGFSLTITREGFVTSGNLSVSESIVTTSPQGTFNCTMTFHIGTQQWAARLLHTREIAARNPAAPDRRRPPAHKPRQSLPLGARKDLRQQVQRRVPADPGCPRRVHQPGYARIRARPPISWIASVCRHVVRRVCRAAPRFAAATRLKITASTQDWYLVGTRADHRMTCDPAKRPRFAGPLGIAGAGFEPATSGL
jgi:hypothetical protein